jgi:hypothetical protein
MTAISRKASATGTNIHTDQPSTRSLLERMLKRHWKWPTRMISSIMSFEYVTHGQFNIHRKQYMLYYSQTSPSQVLRVSTLPPSRDKITLNFHNCVQNHQLPVYYLLVHLFLSSDVHPQAEQVRPMIRGGKPISKPQTCFVVAQLDISVR